MSDLVSVLVDSVRGHADRPALGVRSDAGWRWMSYAQLGQRIDALRAGLASIGVGRGDRVAVISRNRAEWVEGCYATLGLGAAYVPMYEEQLDRDWRHILTDSGARICLVSGAVAPRVAALATSIPSLERVVDFDDPESYGKLVAYGAGHPVAATTPEPGDLAKIVYTSGTTGTPKGVLLTHTNIVSNIASSLQVVPMSCEDRTLAFLPWAHVMGSEELHGIIQLGASAAICDSVERIAAELGVVKPTILFAVPRVWNKVYQGVQQTLRAQPRMIMRTFEHAARARHRQRRGEHPALGDALALAIAQRVIFPKIRDHFGGRLRLAVSAAAALAPEVAEFIDDIGIVVLEAYGLTEATAVATLNRPDDRRIGSVGKPIPGVRVVLDRTVQGARPDEGEIVIYGHGVMAGYHNLPEETARALTTDGGLRTGDVGRFDDDGFLFVTGRIKELYKLENGKYVAPAVLEEKLTLSPFIDQAFVHGANRPHNVALLVPNRAAIEAWARQAGAAAPPFPALMEDPAVRALFDEEIARESADFKGYERVAAFTFLEEPFSTENGLLTPTLKVKRRRVLERYAQQLEALYAAPAVRVPAPETPTKPAMARQ